MKGTGLSNSAREARPAIREPEPISDQQDDGLLRDRPGPVKLSHVPPDPIDHDAGFHGYLMPPTSIDSDSDLAWSPRPERKKSPDLSELFS